MVRNSIVMGGFSFFNPGGGGGGTRPHVVPGRGQVPSVVLTVQSALAGTLLANGTSIPRPGESVIVKLDPRFGQTGADRGVHDDGEYLDGRLGRSGVRLGS